MNPIFHHDVPKYLFQMPDIPLINNYQPSTSFKIKGPEKACKTKKDLEKQKKKKLGGFFGLFNEQDTI